MPEMPESTQLDSPRARAGNLDDPSWAWAPYRPDAQLPWSLELAAHLYRRAAFGANWGELQQALADGPELAVGKLLRPKAEVSAFNRDYDAYEEAAVGSAGGVRPGGCGVCSRRPTPYSSR